MAGKKAKVIITIVTGFYISAICWSCSARRGLPLADPVTPHTVALKEGQILFQQYCDPCHPKGTAGLGFALNNKPLPKFMIRFQIRAGLGVMPAFDKETLSTEEVTKIVNYVAFLRKQD